MPSQTKPWFMPATDDLADLIQRYTNCAIAKACSVSDVTVKTWLVKLGLERKGKGQRYRPEVPVEVIDQSEAVRCAGTSESDREWKDNPRKGEPRDRPDRRGGQGRRSAA